MQRKKLIIKLVIIHIILRLVIIKIILVRQEVKMSHIILVRILLRIKREDD